MAKSIARKGRVLVVEDEPALQEAIKFKLEQRGIQVSLAATGEEALNLAKAQRPDLVWLDILLPGMSGLEVLEKMRQDRALKNLAVVMVSVSAGPEKIKEAFEMKALDYIIKSDNKLDDIIERIDVLLSALPASAKLG
jgi:CheY-like chemotaxis protein